MIAVRFVRAFLRFWYDFVIGDDWKIATSVAVVLVTGALLAHNTHLPDGATAVLLGLALLAAFVVEFAIDTRHRR
ncbi:MAG TPA: hypothetical protein VF995_08520 [Actinomycetota bacterium]